MMLRAFVLVLAFSAPFAAKAEIPFYEVEEYCRSVSEFSGGSMMIYNGCIQMEQSSYDSLVRVWSTLPSRVRSYCDEVSRFVGGSYQILQGCVEMEMSAGNAPSQFRR